VLQVRLDDGTVKDINCEYVRMLPPTFLLKKEDISNGYDGFGKDKSGKESGAAAASTLTNSYGSNKNKPNILLGKRTCFSQGLANFFLMFLPVPY
jgi:hypothetical protein